MRQTCGQRQSIEPIEHKIENPLSHQSTFYPRFKAYSVVEQLLDDLRSIEMDEVH